MDFTRNYFDSFDISNITCLDTSNTTLVDAQADREHSQLQEIIKKLGLTTEVKHIENNIYKYERAITHKLNESSHKNDLIALEMEKRKHNLHIAKFKSQSNYFRKRNESILKDIESAKNTLVDAQIQINSMNTSSDLPLLEAKIEKYKNGIVRTEKKHQWLTDPQYNLIHLNNEILKLKSLQNECAVLEDELKVYEGLPPNLSNAKKLVEKLKLDYMHLKQDK